MLAQAHLQVAEVLVTLKVTLCAPVVSEEVENLHAVVLDMAAQLQPVGLWDLLTLLEHSQSELLILAELFFGTLLSLAGVALDAQLHISNYNIKIVYFSVYFHNHNQLKVIKPNMKTVASRMMFRSKLIVNEDCRGESADD